MGKELNDNDVAKVSGGRGRKTYRSCPICKELNGAGSNQWLYTNGALKNHMENVHKEYVELHNQNDKLVK